MLRLHPFLVASLVVLAGATPGCRKRTGKMSQIEAIVVQLKSDRAPAREAAAEKLMAMARSGLSLEEGVRALRAARDEFPPRSSPFASSRRDLIRATMVNPHRAYSPVVKEIYPALDASSRMEVLDLLTRIEEREGAQTFMSLIRSSTTAPFELRLSHLESHPQHGDVYFPELLRLTSPPHDREPWRVFLACARSRRVSQGTIESTIPVVTERWAQLSAKLEAASAAAGDAPGWQWSEEYAELREEAGVLLDVMGFLEDDGSKQVLQKMVSNRDPRLAFFALGSLLRRGLEPRHDTLERIAADDEMRGPLARLLAQQGRSGQFPPAWRTEAAFARSEMVSWLKYPTELGRGPDELELLRVETSTTTDGHFDWYLFRFRTLSQHWSTKEGWLVGVAGPFRREDGPTPDAYGGTFSSFERYEARSAEDHTRRLREITARWAARNRDAERPPKSSL